MGDNVGDRVDEQSVYQQVRWSVYDSNGINFQRFLSSAESDASGTRNLNPMGLEQPSVLISV